MQKSDALSYITGESRSIYGLTRIISCSSFSLLGFSLETICLKTSVVNPTLRFLPWAAPLEAVFGSRQQNIPREGSGGPGLGPCHASVTLPSAGRVLGLGCPVPGGGVW